MSTFTRTSARAALALAAAVSLAAVPFAPAALAQNGEPIVVPLSEPGRPATLEVSLVSGSITVTAHDRDEVVISLGDGGADDDDRDDDDDDAEAARQGREGLRRIPNTAIGLTAEERNNAVTVAVDWNRRGVDLEVLVPRQTSVRARTVNGGAVEVAGVSGDHELQNVNGAVRATDISGSAVIGTTNGDVEVSFSELTAGKAMSFTSFNGDVEVSFPDGLAADLRMNAGRGEVLTDFEVEVQPQTSVVDRSGDAGRYRVRMEREVRATVGGGGPEVQLKTFNGDIVIRRRQ